MTRETKIGLLVGLAFIIVIGILLSDHLTSTLQPPQAPLSVAATNAREALRTPGAGQIAHERPVRVPDAEPNPLVIGNDGGVRREPGRAEITILPPPSNGARDIVIPPSEPQQSNRVTPPPQHDAQAAQAFTPKISPGLNRILDEHPDEVIAVPAQPVRQYLAESGDTISKIARLQLGADTIANRNAILRLNPSLKNNPRMRRAGETSRIPVASAAPTPIPVGTPPSNPTTPPIADGDNLYTTRPGDTLWRIAVNHVGSHTAVEQIKALNRDLLNGTDRIKPGMKLKLPSKSLASTSQANSSH
jgi:LysM repeat protein